MYFERNTDELEADSELIYIVFCYNKWIIIYILCEFARKSLQWKPKKRSKFRLGFTVGQRSSPWMINHSLTLVSGSQSQPKSNTFEETYFSWQCVKKSRDIRISLHLFNFSRKKSVLLKCSAPKAYENLMIFYEKERS